MANHLPNMMYTLPSASTTLTTKQLRETLLATDGWIIVNGRRRRIRSNNLGAGVYRVFTEEV